jgi:hypothetical protein
MVLVGIGGRLGRTYGGARRDQAGGGGHATA